MLSCGIANRFSSGVACEKDRAQNKPAWAALSACRFAQIPKCRTFGIGTVRTHEYTADETRQLEESPIAWRTLLNSKSMALIIPSEKIKPKVVLPPIEKPKMSRRTPSEVSQTAHELIANVEKVIVASTNRFICPSRSCWQKGIW